MRSLFSHRFGRRYVLFAALGLLLSGCEGGHAPGVDAVISLDQQTVKLAQATIQVDYSETAIKAASEGGQVQCTYIDPRVSGSFQDDQNGKLTLKVQAAKGFAGPMALAACHLIPKDPESSPQSVQDGIVVRIVKAQDDTGKVIDPMVAARRAVAPVAPPVPAATGPTRDKAALKVGSGVPGMDAANRPHPAQAPAPKVPPAGGPAKAPAPAPKPTPPPQATAPAVPRIGGDNKPAETAADRVRERIARNLPLGAKAGPASAASAPEPEPSEAGLPEDNYDTSPRDDPSTPEYEITISVLDKVGRISAIQLDLTHLGNSGGFIARDEGGADCLFFGGVIGVGNQLTGSRNVSIGLISLEGVPTPTELATCTFRSSETVYPGNFQIQVIEASDKENVSISPLPQAAVTNIVRR